MFQPDQFNNNIICYHGTINIDLVSFISNFMKQQINTNSLVINKIYKVFIELAQNVSYYSAEQFDSSRTFGSGIGWFRVDEDSESYKISTGNRILKEHAPLLLKNSKEINSLPEEDLRELKRKTRSLANIKDIGAHIGLIQTGIITGNQIFVNIEPIDEVFNNFLFGKQKLKI
jgi:hypothetical protein